MERSPANPTSNTTSPKASTSSRAEPTGARRIRALVFGGNRYIGLSLVFELARQGHEVTVANSHEAALPDGARRLHVDRQVPGELTRVLSDHRDDFDIVYDNTAFEISDLAEVVDLFSGRIAQLVFTSSIAVYKRSFIQPILESFPRHPPGSDDPRKAYGVHKVECEDHLFSLSDAFDVTVLRVGHTIGPRSPLVTREPRFFARLEQGRPIPIPGEGFPMVQFVHIDDVARAMAAVAGRSAAAGQAYTIHGAEATSVRGAVVLMARAVGVEPEIVQVPLEIARQMPNPGVHWGEALVGGAYFSIEKAQRDLRWTPQFGLESGYRDSYEWFAAGGRDNYEFDFSDDEAVFEALTGT
ncbi:MAG: NAD-dependent epimerase/dehydratase family protein [Acidimicrobiales bacterium]